ncbi:unnamed protein product [Prunus brigantina]
MVKGYTQRYEIDYQKTFAPVAKINTIRVLLSLAANLDWPLHQFDVKNAFLHGDLEEEVYMDLPPGCNFARDRENQKLKLQKYLSQEFKMKDLGDLKYFLGIEVTRSTNGIFLSQRKYVLDLLTETRMLGCKPANTPIEMNHKLCEDMDQEPTNKEQYQRLVGRLIYLAHTRPDIAYAVSMVSHAEAEYRGMVHGVCELLWIRRLLTELGFKPRKPMELYCDNKSAIDIAHNPVQHDRTKHVEVDRHFIKEKIEKKIICLSFIKSEDQLANILTKAVCSRVFHDSLTKLGIGDVYAPT